MFITYIISYELLKVTCMLNKFKNDEFNKIEIFFFIQINIENRQILQRYHIIVIIIKV